MKYDKKEKKRREKISIVSSKRQKKAFLNI